MNSTEVFLSDEVQAVMALEAQMREVYKESADLTEKQKELLNEMHIYNMRQMSCAARLVALEDAMRKLLVPL